jgi:hypothetical protein
MTGSKSQLAAQQVTATCGTHLLGGQVQLAVALLHAGDEVPQCHGNLVALPVGVCAATPVLHHDHSISPLQVQAAHALWLTPQLLWQRP